MINNLIVISERVNLKNPFQQRWKVSALRGVGRIRRNVLQTVNNRK